MKPLDYERAGLVVGRNGSGATEAQVRALQKDLRRLGYLRRGIDGIFGRETELAVRSLRHDLLRNEGKSNGGDGEAPVKVIDYNRGRVMDVAGEVDHWVAGCMRDMLEDPEFITLPSVEAPAAENKKVVRFMREMRPSSGVPTPFLLAILKQESGLRHYNEPGRGDDDTYITIGLDRNSTSRHFITSRGYGVGQYTVFHHPPRKKEAAEFMLTVEKNILRAVRVLGEKFVYFVNGNTTGTRADDRIAEQGTKPLTPCKYPSDDSRFMQDCRTCALEAGTRDIIEGITPIYKGARFTYRPTRYYRKASYRSVPVRKNLGCDWPYAARRYNGSGMNSYHYQLRVLKNLSSL